MTDASYGTGDSLTAFYDTRAEAESAAGQLRAAGVADDAIHLSADASARSGDGKGFFESLSDFFFTDEDRDAYSEGIRRGGAVLTVTDVDATRRDALVRLLEGAGAVDIDEREGAWRDEGWTAGGAAATGAVPGTGWTSDAATSQGGAAAGATIDLGAGETVPVVEENLRVGKRDVAGGRVRIRSHVREEPVTAEVELSDQRVEVERRVVDRPLGAGEDAFRERTVEAAEHREEAVVAKEARVVEEVGLRVDRETRRETISDTVRRTEVEIERDDDLTNR
jgi:stress response protein YsnF